MVGLYVHVPFCHSECTYCDFYRTGYRDELAWTYLEALEVEIAGLPRGLRPSSVFVGGGTPSALRAPQLERLLNLLAGLAVEVKEYTFEVNPRSTTPEKARLLAEAGVTRVSFGGQTFDDEALSLLGRRHRSEHIVTAFEMLREHIASINFDLIFALPGQSLEAWESDLARAVELDPDHLSAYSLTYESGTPLSQKVLRGELCPAGEELERAMFLRARDYLSEHGLEHYEISNYAKPGHACVHNLVYWNQSDYYGIGPAACSTLGSRRFRNLPDVDRYTFELKSRGLPPRSEETLSATDKLNEHIMLKLRTREGLSLEEFARRAGCSLEEYAGGKLSPLLQSRLLERQEQTLRLTEEGLCVADSVVCELFAPA